MIEQLWINSGCLHPADSDVRDTSCFERVEKVFGALWYLEPAAGVCMGRLIEGLIEVEPHCSRLYKHSYVLIRIKQYGNAPSVSCPSHL